MKLKPMPKAFSLTLSGVPSLMFPERKTFFVREVVKFPTNPAPSYGPELMPVAAVLHRASYTQRKFLFRVGDQATACGMVGAAADTLRVARERDPHSPQHRQSED